MYNRTVYIYIYIYIDGFASKPHNSLFPKTDFIVVLLLDK